MATDQTLSVKITGDTSGLVKATNTAAKSLSDLQQDVKDVDSASIDIKVQSNTGTTVSELDDLKKKTDTLDQESIEIPAKLELANINRDTANLKKVLDGIDKRKAEPDVGMDLTQLLKDEAKVKRELDALDKRRVDVEASMSVDETGLSGFQGAIAGVRGELEGGGGGGGIGLIGGLGLARAGIAGAGLTGAMATAVPVIGTAAAVLGTAAKSAWDLGEAAADVETSVSQLGALVGNQELGAKTFEDLQKWAAKTPFAIDDATEATKKLVAAGVPLKNIPDYLNDVGNVASATGVPLDQMATVFAQMESTGKASYENLQQLAEAGIPVWQTLSKELGITVGEAQDLASKGKLGADAIDLVRESLAAKFPTAMSDQAATFNGQMSTLKDNLDQTKQSLGTIFLPAMSELMGLFNTGAGYILNAANALSDWNQKISDATGGFGIVQLLSPAAAAVHFLSSRFKGSGDAAKKMGDDAKAAADKVKKQIAEAAASPEALKKAFDAAVQQLGDIGVDVRAHVSFIISKAQLQREIDKATSGKDAVELPANLKLGQIRGLSDKQFELLSSLSSAAEQGIRRGAELAAQNPGKFNFNAYYRKMRADLRPLLIEANIDPKQVDRVLTNILGVPRVQAIKPEVRGYEDAVKGMTKPLTVPLTPKVNAGPANETLKDTARPRVVAIKATPTNIDGTDKTLDRTAAERKALMWALAGNTALTDRDLNAIAHDRTVHYKLDFDANLYQHMNDRLDSLARNRTVSFSGSGAVGGVSAPRGVSVGGTMWTEPLAGGPMLMASQQMAAGAQTMFLPSQGGQRTTYVAPPPTQIRPRQTPIAVYLDGEEIATHMELRAKRLAASNIVTGRRA